MTIRKWSHKIIINQIVVSAKDSISTSRLSWRGLLSLRIIFSDRMGCSLCPTKGSTSRETIITGKKTTIISKAIMDTDPTPTISITRIKANKNPWRRSLSRRHQKKFLRKEKLAYLKISPGSLTRWLTKSPMLRLFKRGKRAGSLPKLTFRIIRCWRALPVTRLRIMKSRKSRRIKTLRSYRRNLFKRMIRTSGQVLNGHLLTNYSIKRVIPLVDLLHARRKPQSS